jgi:fibronectin type 3 domain-containing protein
MRATLPLVLTALLSLGAALNSSVQAQPAGKLQVLALGNKASVSLRLPILPGGLPAAGYTVKRSGPGGAQTLSVKPLNKLEATARYKLDPEDYDLAVGALRALEDDKLGDEERGYLLLNLLSTVTDAKLARALNLIYEDDKLAPGSYTYTVSAGSQTLGTVTAQVGKDVPLAAPTGLKAAPGLRQAALSWARGDEMVVAYRTQRAAGAGEFANLTANPQIVNRGVSPAFADARLDPKLSYRYRVTALDVFGRESAPGNVVTLEARLTVPLVAPVFTKAAGQQNQVELAWPKVTDPNIKEITLLRGDHPGKPSILVKLPATAASYTDKTATPAQHRYYSLKVSDGSRTSEASPEWVGRAYNETPPAAPSALKAAEAETNISLSWTPGPEKDLAGYNVYRAELAPGGGAPITLLNGQPITAPSFKDSVPQGVQSQFRYLVRAVNTSGVEGAPSSPVTASLTDKTAPDVPLLLRAGSAPGRIALIFTLPPTPDLKAFEIYRAAQNEAQPVKVATLPPDSLGYVDSKVRGDVQYSYAVIALDTHGNASKASNVMAASAPPDKLVAPEGLKALLDGKQVRLSWTDSPAALGYYVFRTVGRARVQIAGPLQKPSYQEEARKGVRYSVQAVNASGATGPLSAEVEVR